MAYKYRVTTDSGVFTTDCLTNACLSLEMLGGKSGKIEYVKRDGSAFDIQSVDALFGRSQDLYKILVVGNSSSVEYRASSKQEMRKYLDKLKELEGVNTVVYKMNEDYEYEVVMEGDYES